MRVLRQAVSVIQQQTGFSGRFKSGRLEREGRPAYALFALREGLVNAIVHRDYQVVGGQLRVEIFPEHLIIENPGQLPEGWTEKDILTKEESHLTNPDIARVFYLRSLMESPVSLLRMHWDQEPAVRAPGGLSAAESGASPHPFPSPHLMVGGEHIGYRTQGGSRFAPLPWAIVMPPLRGFGRAGARRPRFMGSFLPIFRMLWGHEPDRSLAVSVASRSMTAQRYDAPGNGLLVGKTGSG